MDANNDRTQPNASNRGESQEIDFGDPGSPNSLFDIFEGTHDGTDVGSPVFNHFDEEPPQPEAEAQKPPEIADGTEVQDPLVQDVGESQEPSGTAYQGDPQNIPVTQIGDAELSGIGYQDADREGSEQTESPNSANGGRTEIEDGQLMWVDPNTEQRRPAVMHYDIRRQLQLAAQQAYPGESYAHPDDNLGDPLNDTSFLKAHQHWGADRKNRPDVLFAWEAPLNWRSQPSKKPGFMVFEDKIVLDNRNNPLRDYPDIPATLSPHVQGYKLEAMARMNPAIVHQDCKSHMCHADE